MLFLESLARPLLVVHTIAAAVVVGATTHHLIWMRGYARGSFTRVRAERRFALIATAAYVVTFTLGNLLYPTYKVRVRAEYLDDPMAIAAAARQRAVEDQLVGAPRATAPPANLSPVARGFDIKEQGVALGCAASLLLLWLSRRVHPSENPQAWPLYFGLAAFACAMAWLGAIVGIVTASFRAVG